MNLNYSTPLTSRAPSPFRYQEDESTVATLQEPIIRSSESEVLSVSTKLSLPLR